jgi:hypothetical protein
MKTTSLWIIRAALTVQFLCVLAVPVLVAQDNAPSLPRAIWIAEWVRPAVAERTIGVLKLQQNRLLFDEQAGHASWTIDLASVKRIVNAHGRSVTIETIGGQTYVLAIMERDLTIGSPKRVVDIIERAMLAGASRQAARR